jgi:CubicO group peptidase (beta-lactamase class C family)
MPERSRPSSREDALVRFLGELFASGGISAGVALVGDAREVTASAAVGVAVAEPASAATAETWFDLASLTKPVVATLAVVLDQRGLLPLDLPVGAVFERAHERLGERRLGELLRHCSGLAAWAPLYARCASREDALALLLSGELLTEDGETYSDLGLILWGFAAEASLGAPLARLLAEHLLEPLGLAAGPSPGPRPTVAETRLSNGREVELAAAQGIELATTLETRHGVVHDGNARFLGGLAAHAGLFGTAGALWRIGREWLAPGSLLARASVETALAGGDRFALGWWRPRGHENAGPALSADAFGMVGFTGGSLWLDHGHGSRRMVAVLLTHRTSTSFDMAPWRRRFHGLAADLLSEGQPALEMKGNQ